MVMIRLVKLTFTMTKALLERGMSKEIVMVAFGYKRTLSALDLSVSGKTLIVSTVRGDALDAPVFDMIELIDRKGFLIAGLTPSERLMTMTTFKLFGS